MIRTIEFIKGDLKVKEKDTPEETEKAIDARVYFKGFAGDSNIKMRVKLDVSQFEKIVLPVQQHHIIHPYSDSDSLKDVNVFSYSLEEILAEKLRSWIQRTRSRDIFDIVKIVESKKIPISKLNIMKTFFAKTLYKGIPAVAKEDLLFDEKFQTIESSWEKSIICPQNSKILAQNAITAFQSFINVLFTPESLGELGISSGVMTRNPWGRTRSVIRETLIEAGKNRNLIRMRYSNKDRDIEPYAIKYQIRKSDNTGHEYFYGYDRTRGKHMKKFFVSKIQNVSILAENYIPRYVVEF